MADWDRLTVEMCVELLKDIFAAKCRRNPPFVGFGRQISLIMSFILSVVIYVPAVRASKTLRRTKNKKGGTQSGTILCLDLAGRATL